MVFEPCFDRNFPVAAFNRLERWSGATGLVVDLPNKPLQCLELLSRKLLPTQLELEPLEPLNCVLELLGAALCGGHWVVDLVGDTGHQRTEAGHLLRLNQLRLCSPQLLMLLF